MVAIRVSLAATALLLVISSVVLFITGCELSDRGLYEKSRPIVKVSKIAYAAAIALGIVLAVTCFVPA